MSFSKNHYDVLVFGAGLSGIGAAHHLQKYCPQKKFVILEGRESIGGTWDLFRYPGVRSDSSMETMGYSFRPWKQPKSISEGGTILQYIKDTAVDEGLQQFTAAQVLQHDKTMPSGSILCGHKVVAMNWSSEHREWVVDVDVAAGGGDNYGSPQRTTRKTVAVQSKGNSTSTVTRVRHTANFVVFCSGYYEYADGYTPDFPGRADFRGTIVHPQHWPPGLSVEGKRVVIIGSGATAVTLLPALVGEGKAAHVTQLQRSPSYVASVPSPDPTVTAIRSWQWLLGDTVVGWAVRWFSILSGMYFYLLAKRYPLKVRRGLQKLAKEQLGPAVDREYMARHFDPKYDPWDQRLCLVPEADFYKALRSGRASMATDTIDRFTADGIRLASSGEILPADVIVTATGLQMKLAGGVAISVNGTPFDISQTLMYKGVMLGGLPNCVVSTGYINATFTLKCDLTFDYTCRLLNHMDRYGYSMATPVRTEANGGMDVTDEPIFALSSSYVLRSQHLLPKQGRRHPWRYVSNYLRDIWYLYFGWVTDDGVLKFQ